MARRILGRANGPSRAGHLAWGALLLALGAIAGCNDSSGTGAQPGTSGSSGGDSAAAADSQAPPLPPPSSDASSDGSVQPDASSAGNPPDDALAPEVSGSWDADLSDGGGSDGSSADADAAEARSDADAASTEDGALAGWKLTWSDEFDGPQGAPPDNTKWTAQMGPSGVNGELEDYTARPSNLALDGNGNLLITALREAYMGSNYTSARIDTAGKFSQMYGRFEARMKLPAGQGMWPAFWMLGTNIGQVGWPACGEVDIMENVGRAPTLNNGAIHGQGYTGANFTTEYVLAGGYTSDFHVFAAEIELNVVRLYVDGNLYETRTPADVAKLGGGLPWDFNHPFYLILNLAVGGAFPGNPDGTTPFPQSLTVDYVRVYSR